MLFKVQGKGSLCDEIYDVYAVAKEGYGASFLIFEPGEWRGWKWIDSMYYNPIKD